MKNTTIGVCLAGLISLTAALAAQTPPPQAPASPTGAGPAGPKDEKTISLTGCLQKGDRPNTYILSNVTGDTAAIFGRTATMAPRPTEPVKLGTAGTSGVAPMIVTLQETAGVSLAEHVGHKVEVTGMVVPQGRKKDDDAAGLTLPGANPPAGQAEARPAQTEARTDVNPENAGGREVGTAGAKAEPRVNVRTVNHISPKCS